MVESAPGHQVLENPRLRGFFACMPAAFRAAGRLPAAGFGANFKPSHLIRGRRALSPSSPSALEFVMATRESPRPPIVMSRLDYDRIRSEEHKSDIQSLMHITYTVFCLHKN